MEIAAATVPISFTTERNRPRMQIMIHSHHCIMHVNGMCSNVIRFTTFWCAHVATVSIPLLHWLNAGCAHSPILRNFWLMQLSVDIECVRVTIKQIDMISWNSRWFIVCYRFRANMMIFFPQRPQRIYLMDKFIHKFIVFLIIEPHETWFVNNFCFRIEMSWVEHAHSTIEIISLRWA